MIILSENLNQIYAYLASLDDAQEIHAFFESMFTPAELKDLDSRWQIIKMLDAGISQRQIARELHVSLCKITRGSKELKKHKSELKKAVQRFSE